MVLYTGVATAKPASRGSTTILHNLAYILDIKEWVAPGSNNTDALNPKIGMVHVYHI